MKMNYPFMLSDSQWDEVKKDFESKTRKRKQSLQVTLSAVIYLLRTGCQWRMLPQDAYGNWELVYYYYRKWMAYAVLESLLYKLVGKVRERKGRTKEPTAAVIDTQSIKTPAGVSEQTGYDGGKKVKGRKRSIATDMQGNIIAAGVSTAGSHDSKAVKVLQQEVEDYDKITTIFADGAFKGDPPFDKGGKIKWKIVSKKGGPFKVLPKRWVVERSIAWLNNFRRLTKDYEKNVECSKAMIIMAAITVTLNKLFN
jgi:putative transposase